VNSRSALPREQLTIRKANLYEGSGRQIGMLRMPAALTKKHRTTTAMRQFLPRQQEHGV